MESFEYVEDTISSEMLQECTEEEAKKILQTCLNHERSFMEVLEFARQENAFYPAVSEENE